MSSSLRQTLFLSAALWVVLVGVLAYANLPWIAERQETFARGLAPATPAPTLVTVTSFGCDAFVTSAHWERVHGRLDGRRGGESVRSVHPGANASLDFEGSAVRLFGVLGRGGGLGVVSIDGHPASVVNFFATHKTTHARVYEIANLARGTHRLTIEVVAPPRDRPAGARYVNLEGAEVVR